MSNASQQPAVVEDEPPHEFYANLLGKKPPVPKASRAAANIECPDTIAANSQQESLPVVVADLPQQPKSDIAKVYHRALSDPPKLSSLSLDQSNKGFKLLSRMGWKEEDGGLGRKRQGSMTPVKTRLKNNKLGLGMGRKSEARVTHAHPPPRPATEPMETKAQRKRRKRMELQQQQAREKRTKMLLRTDVDDEYEKLYVSLHGG